MQQTHLLIGKLQHIIFFVFGFNITLNMRALQRCTV